MERLLITGGNEYLPFARKIARDMRKLGLPYMDKVLDVEDVRIKIRLTPAETFISIEGGYDPLYQFITTGTNYIYGIYSLVGGIPLCRGYAVGAKYDRASEQVKGVALGSTAEEDTEDPPRWEYKLDAGSIGKMLPYKEIQVQFIPLAIHYPDAKSSNLIQTVWTSPIEINDADSNEDSPSFTRSLRYFDRGYDAAVMRYAKTGKPKDGGYAPDTDWYRRAAVVQVESKRWGARTLYLMVDVSNTLHVFHVSEIDQSLVDGSIYADQFIKTNIPNSSAVKVRIPTPNYARQPAATPARDQRLDRPFPERDYDPPLTCKRWEFNSSGTKMASVMISDSEKLMNGKANDINFSEKEIEGVTSAFGMQEIAIDITITGEEPSDFTVSLRTTAEVPPSDDRCIIGVGYYWGDIPDLHSPTGVDKDTLLCIELDVYQKLEASTLPIEPMASEEMAMMSVKEFHSGRVVSQSVTSHTEAPLGLKGEPRNQSFIALRRDDPAFLDNITFQVFSSSYGGNESAAAVTRLALGVKKGKLLDDIDLLLDAPGFESTPTNQAKFENLLQVYCKECLETIVDSGNTDVVRFQRDIAALNNYMGDSNQGNIPTIRFRTSLLAYDLRVMGFAFQRSYFDPSVPGTSSREDRVTVYMRGEVKHQSAQLAGVFAGMESAYSAMTSPPGDFQRVLPSLKKNPKFSIRAYQAYSGYGLQGTRAAPPESRETFNVEYPIGQLIYQRQARELMGCLVYDIFCIHPHGHWSLKTVPIVYYPGPSKYFRPGRYTEEVILPVDDPDLSRMVQIEVDVISVVTIKDQKPVEVKTTHLDLFNEAYHRTPALTAADFRWKFELQIAPAGDGLTRRTIVVKVAGAPPLYATYAVFSQSPGLAVVRRSVPATYLDVRAASVMGLADTNYSINNASVSAPTSSVSDFVPIGRGSCMFIRRKEIKA